MQRIRRKRRATDEPMVGLFFAVASAMVAAGSARVIAQGWHTDYRLLSQVVERVWS